MSSLDGVRGLAALVVVLHHSLLAGSATLASGYAGTDFKVGTAAWWLYFTPLHLLWAGPEAVTVFFVLSGFVLALPAARRGIRSLRLSYYPKRLIRLYAPVWAALLVAAGWRTLQGRTDVAGASWWLNDQAVPMTVHAGLVQATLRDQGTWAFDPVLWSLHWEVLYSLVLPVALILPLATRRRPVAATTIGVAALVCVAVGAARGIAQAEYLPMFVIGALLAFHVAGLRARVARARTSSVILVAAGCIFLITADYWVRPGWVSTASVQPYLFGATKSAVVVGAAAVLALAIGRRSWGRALDRRPVVWLGSRSFSLYLVHEPIVVSVTYALGGRPPALVVLGLAIPAALVVTEVFWRVVERPSVRLAHRAGSILERSGPAARHLPARGAAAEAAAAPERGAATEAAAGPAAESERRRASSVQG